MLHIKNAKFSNGNLTDILIENSFIRCIGEKSRDYVFAYKGELETIDAGGAYVLPAFIDSHFHLRNPGQEQKQTYEEAALACVKGGYQAFVAMANTNPVVDSVDLIQELESNMAKHPVRLYQASAISRGLLGKTPVDFELNAKRTRFFSDDGKNVDDPMLMALALKASKDYNFIVMDHSEPETEMVVRNIDLAKKTGGNLHFCHVSKKESVAAIMRAKDGGLNISFELTPHHLFSSDLNYRVNPPIGNKEDREFLLKAVKEGYVDTIGTDHAPHTAEDKAAGSPGISNVETAYSMVRYALYEYGIGMETLEKLMCRNAGAMLGINASIEEGAFANLVIVDDEPTVIDVGAFVGRSKNSPYDGYAARGKVLYTINAGRVVYSAVK